MRPAALPEARPLLRPARGKSISLYASCLRVLETTRSPAATPAWTAVSMRSETCATCCVTTLLRRAGSRSTALTSRSRRRSPRRMMRSARVRALRVSVWPRRSRRRSVTPRRDVSVSTTPVATVVTRSRASTTAPTYTRPARSATLRPCLAVVLAARALACAAWRVSFLALLRARRPGVFVGDLRAVERLVERDALLRDVVREAVERDALRVVVLLRAVLPLLVPLLRLVVLLELLFVAVAMWSFPLVASQSNDISS